MSDPSRDQAGRPAPEQPGHRSAGHRRAVGAGGDRFVHRPPGRGGLDGLRRRPTDHLGLGQGHPARPSHAAVVADGDEGRPNEQAQRLRGCLPDETGRGSARRRRGDDPGGPGLRRYDAVRLPRDARLRPCHPVPGQHAPHGGDGRAPPGRGLGRQGRPPRPDVLGHLSRVGPGADGRAGSPAWSLKSGPARSTDPRHRPTPVSAPASGSDDPRPLPAVVRKGSPRRRRGCRWRPAGSTGARC